MKITLQEAKRQLEELQKTKHACDNIASCITNIETAITVMDARTSEDFGKPFDYYKEE